MRVPDVVLKCVGFIGHVVHQDSSGNVDDADWVGTGFFVSIPGILQPSKRFHLFVTAKHVAESLKDKSLCFAVNKTGGGVTSISGLLGAVGSGRAGSWWTHPSDDTADIAVLPFNMTPDLDIASVPMEDFLTRDRLLQKNIGIGDEIFATGLFTFVPSGYTGVRRNMPIVRHGNIAMIPDEQIQTELGYADVYLVEARSVGGLSGSPVFARQTVALKAQTQDGEQWVHGNGGMFLLGLIHGHWDIKESEINKPHATHDRKRGVNMGVGIVVPAYKIIETANRPELIEMRQEFEASVISS